MIFPLCDLIKFVSDPLNAQHKFVSDTECWSRIDDESNVWAFIVVSDLWVVDDIEEEFKYVCWWWCSGFDDICSKLWISPDDDSRFKQR